MSVLAGALLFGAALFVMAIADNDRQMVLGGFMAIIAAFLIGACL
jgi:hypothetical protein